MDQEAQEAFEAAEQIIRNCQRTKATHLNLSIPSLSEIPSAIGQLTWLEHIEVIGTDLKKIPAEIGNISTLTHLNLQNNQIEELPPEIGNLSALAYLTINANNITHLPPEIGHLKNLFQLIADNNRISIIPGSIKALQELSCLRIHGNNISNLPPELFTLKNLKELSLSANPLAIIPSAIGKLTALTELYIAANDLSWIPLEIGNLKELRSLVAAVNQLKVLPQELENLKNLRHLDLTSNNLAFLPPWLLSLNSLSRIYLHGNKLLRLSPTILGEDPQKGTESGISARSILDFYFSRQSEEKRPLNEVKLILVGRGGAGKTSTVNALKGLPFVEGEESTPGIALCDWTMEGCKGEPVTAHVWDFAGQVITHALHQFFFSVRSVYLVVLTGRENNEREDAEYWLRLIKAFGTDDSGNGPPVIVVLNKWDVSGCRPRVDRGALEERYPFIRGFVEVDCKTRKGIQKLKSSLCREVDGLKWVRDPFPKTWDAVRLALTGGRKKKAHLSYSEYRTLCTKHGVLDPGMQDSLAEVLHNLGAALNYRNDPRLREATVLQPEWLTKNVYGLVRRAEKQAGVLKQADIDQVLRAEKDAIMRSYLIQIMERFEIAYPSRSEGGGIWLVPQALPDNQPAAASYFREADDATRLRYTYKALPEGLVARAIVRLHDFVEEDSGKKEQWGSGAILTREGARALIRTEPQDRQVMITVTGPSKPRQQLAGLCRAEMRDIHSAIRGLDPTEETEIDGSWISTKTLEGDEQNHKQTGISTIKGTILIDPEKPNNSYSKRPSRLKEFWKPTVFISYSKSNLNQRKRLESELKILMNEGLIEKQWHDRMITPGEEWDDEIQNELQSADVIIIMVSSAALSTDYIIQHEIPNAMKLHSKGKAVVVPLVLEKCRWDKTNLGALNALPEKARPVNSWNPQSNAWSSVSDGLEQVFLKILDNQARHLR